MLGIVTSLVLLAAGTFATASATTPAMTPRVINGDAEAPEQYPFLVSLLLADKFAEDGAFQAQFCGGTLTSPTTVVTAAHCVVDQKTGEQRAARSILVGFGPNLRDPACGSPGWRRSSSIPTTPVAQPSTTSPFSSSPSRSPTSRSCDRSPPTRPAP